MIRDGSFMPAKNGGGTIQFSPNSSIVRNASTRKTLADTFGPIGLSATITNNGTAVRLTPFTPKQRAAYHAIVQNAATQPGNTKVGSVVLGPGVPTAFNQMIASQGPALGPHYAMAAPDGKVVVVGANPAAYTPAPNGWNLGAPVTASFVHVPGYNTLFNGNGITYIPNVASPGSASVPSAAPSTPAPSTPAPAATAPSATQPASSPAPSAGAAGSAPTSTPAAGWQATLSNLQKNPKSQTLGSAYNTVANWLNASTPPANQSAAANQ